MHRPCRASPAMTLPCLPSPGRLSHTGAFASLPGLSWKSTAPNSKHQIINYCETICSEVNKCAAALSDGEEGTEGKKETLKY